VNTQPVLHRLPQAVQTPSEPVIGVAYSGGGDRIVIQIGVVKAFIARGIIPQFLSGSSAGAFAAALHGWRPCSMEGVNLALHLTPTIPSYLQPSRWQEIVRFVPAAFQFLLHGVNGVTLPSIVDTTKLCTMLRQKLPIEKLGDLEVLTSIAATDLLDGKEFWFEAPNEDIVVALMASSAIPAFFPPVVYNGHYYVDGNVSDVLPILHLAQRGANIIYAVNVSYAGEQTQPPHNLFDTALQSGNILLYQNQLLELDIVRALYPMIHVIPIRPAVTDSPITFTPQGIAAIVDKAYQETLQLLDKVARDQHQC
jgi:NTE family protein